MLTECSAVRFETTGFATEVARPQATDVVLFIPEHTVGFGAPQAPTLEEMTAGRFSSEQTGARRET